MDFKLLKDKNFTLLMLGKITSLIGSSMQSFALSLFVLVATGSATQFASIMAIALIPQLILGPFVGVFVDWFDRRKLMIGLDLLSGLVVTGFASMYFITGELPLGAIYALVMMLSLISTLFQPTIQTVIPTITSKEDLVAANSLNSLIMALGNVIAPALAGVLYGTFGLKFIFVVNAVSFFASAGIEYFLSIPKTHKLKEKLSVEAFLTDFKQGIQFALGQKTILSIVTLAMMLNFALGSFSVGTTYICKTILQVSDFQYGLEQSVGVVAMMIASLCTGYLGKKFTVGKNLYLSLLFTGVVTSFYGIVTFTPFRMQFDTNLIPYMLMLVITFVLCLFIGIANIFVGIYFQSVVPLDYMGRVGTVFSTGAMAAVPISNMFFGVLFDQISPTFIFPLSAVLVIIPVLFYKKVILQVKSETTQEILVDQKIECEMV